MEELNELDGLARQAAALDGEAAASTPQAMADAEDAAMVVSLADRNGGAVAGLLQMAASMLEPLYPRVAAVYNESACQSVGQAVGPLMAKYGFDMGEWGGKYKEELTAAFVCVPIAMATAKALKADVAEREAANPPPKPADPAPPKPSAPLKPGDYGYVEP